MQLCKLVRAPKDDLIMVISLTAAKFELWQPINYNSDDASIMLKLASNVFHPKYL